MASDQDHASRYASTVPLKVPAWCERFIGIPYKDRGHGFDGACCWGLVHLVLRHRCGIEIDPHSDVSEKDVARAHELAERAKADGTWRRVTGSVQVFDVALMKDDPLHIGIIVAPDTLLHVWRAPHSMAMRLDNPRIRNRFLGFYRHCELA